jgi:hypothetical protein
MIEGKPLGASVWHDGAKNAAHNALRQRSCAHAFAAGRYGKPVSEGHTENSRRVFEVCMPARLDRFIVGVLPTIEYANGHSFFVQQRFLTTGVWPTAVHVTFTWGDSAEYAYGKLQRMKDFGMWKLGAINRYSSRAAISAELEASRQGGPNAGSDEEEVERMEARRYVLVTADAHVPPVIPFDRADYDQRAYQHTEWQERVRSRLQSALALALVLNRTMILPEFHCYCDRYFYRLEACMIPGGHHATQLPFVCPFDHIFDSSKWYDVAGRLRANSLAARFAAAGFEGHLYGAQLRRAPQIANSRATLRAAVGALQDSDAAATGSGGVEAMSGAGRGGPTEQPGLAPSALLVGTVPPRSRDVEIAASLAHLSHVHVLQVSLDDAAAMFGGFARSQTASEFHSLVLHLFALRIAYCQKECRFEATMYESVRKKQRDPCVWLDGTRKLRALPGGLGAPNAATGPAA